MALLFGGLLPKRDSLDILDHGSEPFIDGARVQIVPEWQDLGDKKYERFVIKAPDSFTNFRPH